MILALLLSASLLGPACDISIESPGGSKAGSSYSFTVSSSATPVTVTISIGGETFSTQVTTDKQQTLSVTLPDSARGKTIDSVAENKDGCLVSWSETVQ